MIEKTNIDNINTIEYWDSFYKDILTEETKNKRLMYYEDLKLFLKKGSYSLLEIGCGSGYGLNYLLSFFPKYKITGFDISSIAIDKAKKSNNKISFEIFDILKQSIINNYDYILIIQTLEHFDCPFEIIDKCIEHCKYLIISVPYKNAMKNEPSHMTTNYTKEGFDKYNVVNYKVKKYGKRRRTILYIVLKGEL